MARPADRDWLFTTAMALLLVITLALALLDPSCQPRAAPGLHAVPAK